MRVLLSDAILQVRGPRDDFFRVGLQKDVVFWNAAYEQVLAHEADHADLLKQIARLSNPYLNVIIFHKTGEHGAGGRRVQKCAFICA